MSPAAQPLLANWIGYTAGAVVFGIFLVLLVRDLPGRGLRTGWRTLAAAAMAFLWNAGALANLFLDSFLLRLATTAALSLLPALLLDLLVEGRTRRLVLAGYLVSSASIVLHAMEPMFPGFPLHHRTLQLTALGFAPLTLGALVHLRRRRARPPRSGDGAAAVRALLRPPPPAGRPACLAGGAAIHHAGVPLALWVLMQDYRFLLLDAFLRFLANILLAAAFTWAGAVIAARLGWFDFHALSARTRRSVLAGAGAHAGPRRPRCRPALRAASSHAARLRRGDAEALLETIRRMPVRSRRFLAARALPWLHSSRPSADRRLPSAAFRTWRAEPRTALPPARTWRCRRGSNRWSMRSVSTWREQHLRELVSRRSCAHSRPYPALPVQRAERALRFHSAHAAAARRAAAAPGGDLPRYLLKGGEGLIPLERELEIVRAYLEIEALRLGERLAWSIDVPPEALEAPIPVLSLQPLVENAVRHGVAPLGGPGEVRVRARIEQGLCRIEVSDTGASLAPGANPEGIGLDNVRRRLELHFGGGSQLELRREDGRTIASFAVPMERRVPASCGEGGAPMRILIADDEPIVRQVLRELPRSARTSAVVGEASTGAGRRCGGWSGSTRTSFARHPMPQADGLSVGPPAASRDPHAAHHLRHRLRAARRGRAETGAVDYLLKPVRLERLQAALHRARSQLEALRSARTAHAEPPQRIAARAGEEIHLIDTRDIILFRAVDGGVEIVAAGGRYRAPHPLRELERRFPPPQFRRIHRAILINTAHLRSIAPLSSRRYLLRMTGGVEAVVSKRMAAVIREAAQW